LAKYKTSRVVTALKWGLPVIILLLIAITLGATFLNGNEDGVRISFMDEEKSTSDSATRMIKPHFRGLTEKNRPFTVTADEALQIDADNVKLSNIYADINLEKNGNFFLRSNEGKINVKTSRLELFDDVDIHSDTGYEIHTTKVFVDMKKEEIYGNERVDAKATLGSISANGFFISSPDKILRFNDNVKVIIEERP